VQERARNARNVLVPAAPDDDHRALALVAADVLLMSEPVSSSHLTLPDELTRCLSAGRPVVATAPAAGAVAAELARTGGAGLVVPPGEPTRLAGALLALRADPFTRPFYYSIMVAAAALQVVNRVRHRFSPDALRVVADLCLLAPWIYFVAA